MLLRAKDQISECLCHFALQVTTAMTPCELVACPWALDECTATIGCIYEYDVSDALVPFGSIWKDH